jgi:hypothetical protein
MSEEFTLEIVHVIDLFVECSVDVPRYSSGRPNWYLNHRRCARPAQYAVAMDGGYFYRCYEHRAMKKIYADFTPVYGDYTTTIPRRVKRDV